MNNLKNSKTLISTSVLVATMVVATPLFAGGLFGKGGLIRGSIGNFLDKNVQEPILTPVVQAVPNLISSVAATPPVLTNESVQTGSGSGNETDGEHPTEVDEDSAGVEDIIEAEEEFMYAMDVYNIYGESRVIITTMPGADTGTVTPTTNVSQEGRAIVGVNFNNDFENINVTEDLREENTTIYTNSENR